MASQRALRKLSEKMKIWKDNPVLFVCEVFGANPTWQQKEFLMTVAKNDAVAVSSGHGIGKSASLSWLISWFLLTRTNSKIVATAPTKRQLKDILWAELRTWLRKARLSFLTELLEVKAERIEIRGRPEWFASAVSIDLNATPEKQAETLAGYHAKDFLCVIDEASGVPDPVFRPVEGFLTSKGSKVVMTSNPTRLSGYFYEVFSVEATGIGWTRLTFSSEESPIVDKAYCERMEKRYGRDSDEYRVRVLGLFPKVGISGLIPVDTLRKAMRPKEEIDHLFQTSSADIVWGIDPAGGLGGDELALVVRRGGIIKDIFYTSTLRPVEAVKWIEGLYAKTPFKPNLISIEVNAGLDLADMLRQSFPPGLIYEVNVSWSPADKERFFQLRDELWWRVRDLITEGFLVLPKDPELEKQLLAFDYKIIGGKRKVSGKQDLRKKLKRSPDRADALMISIAPFDLIGLRQDFRRWKRNSYLNWRVA